MDDLLARYRKEQKDLVAQATSLKKQALKKTRKGVNAKCEQMQADLDARHRREVAELNGEPQPEPDITPEQLLAAMDLDNDPTPGSRPAPEKEGAPAAPAPELRPRRNRAKERLAKRQAHEDQIRAEAQVEAANAVDYRGIEQESMRRVLEAQNLVLHEVQPDGHCLFRSLADQLDVRHGVSVDVATLRKQVAEHIRTHADEFTPYLFDEASMTLRDVGDYTRELEHTAMWGSDMEILAVAQIHGCPVRVLQAGSAPLTFHEAGTAPVLTVAYYRHTYGLGEHYNLCR